MAAKAAVVTDDAAAAGPSLSVDMRKETRRLHTVSGVLINSKLVFVLTDPQLYGHALGSFYPVYEALEQLVSQHATARGLAPLAACCERHQLWRTAAMADDLQHLLGPGWRTKLPRSTAASEYAAHLKALAAKDPTLLAPYAYSLYVPLLIGVIGQRVKKTLALPGEAGCQFFDTGLPGSERSARLKALRAAVDEAGRQLTPAEYRAVVAESVQLFRRNNAVVREFPLGLAALRSGAIALAQAVPAWVAVLLAGVAAALAVGAVRAAVTA